MAGSASSSPTGASVPVARGSTTAVSPREEIWGGKTRRGKRWKLAASVSTATRASRRSRSTKVASSAALWISCTRSLGLAHQVEAGRDLVERLGERLVELRVRLRSAAHGGVHLELARETRGMADIVGGWLHGRE